MPGINTQFVVASATPSYHIWNDDNKQNGSDICIDIDNMLQTEVTHRGPVSPYDDIGSSNGLVPDGTKPFSVEQFHKRGS